MPGARARRVGSGLLVVGLLAAGCSSDGGAGGGNSSPHPSSERSSGPEAASPPSGLPSASEDPQESSVEAPSRHRPMTSRGHALRPITRLAPNCPAPPAREPTQTADALNARMQGLDLPRWKAADGGASARLSDGRIAWMYGDTLRPVGARPRIHANSLLISSGDCVAEVSGRGVDPLISRGSFDRACWPSVMIAVPAAGGDHLYVTCSRVQRRPGGLLDFDYLGATLATFWVPRGGVPEAGTVRMLTPDRDDEKQINWGASLLVGEDGRLYVYGTQQPGRKGAKGVYVARTSAREPRDYRDWQYWDGERWGLDGSAAAEVLPADVGVSQTFTVHRGREGYVLVSKKGGELGRSVGVWTSASPRGPWRLYSATPRPYDDGSGYVTYQPLAHPALRARAGRLIVSMSHNPTEFGNLLRDPRRARPIFLEVEVP